MKLKCSGGHVLAELNDEEMKKANLGVEELFLAPLGKLESQKFLKHFCNNCNAEFDGAPEVGFENPNETVAEGMILKERGQYMCKKCNSILGEYRVFSKTE